MTRTCACAAASPSGLPLLAAASALTCPCPAADEGPHNYGYSAWRMPAAHPQTAGRVLHADGVCKRPDSAAPAPRWLSTTNDPRSQSAPNAPSGQPNPPLLSPCPPHHHLHTAPLGRTCMLLARTARLWRHPPKRALPAPAHPLLACISTLPYCPGLRTPGPPALGLLPQLSPAACWAPCDQTWLLGCPPPSCPILGPPHLLGSAAPATPPPLERPSAPPPRG